MKVRVPFAADYVAVLDPSSLPATVDVVIEDTARGPQVVRWSPTYAYVWPLDSGYNGTFRYLVAYALAEHFDTREPR